MLNLRQNPDYPGETLDAALHQLEMLIDLLRAVDPERLDFSEGGMIGLSEQLETVAKAVAWAAAQAWQRRAA